MLVRELSWLSAATVVSFCKAEIFWYEPRVMGEDVLRTKVCGSLCYFMAFEEYFT